MLMTKQQLRTVIHTALLEDGRFSQTCDDDGNCVMTMKPDYVKHAAITPPMSQWSKLLLGWAAAVATGAHPAVPSELADATRRNFDDRRLTPKEAKEVGRLIGQMVSKSTLPWEVVGRILGKQSAGAAKKLAKTGERLGKKLTGKDIKSALAKLSKKSKGLKKVLSDNVPTESDLRKGVKSMSTPRFDRRMKKKSTPYSAISGLTDFSQ